VTSLYKKASLSPNPADVFVDWIAENPNSNLKENIVSDIGWALGDPEQFRDYTQKMWASADPEGFKAAMGGKSTDAYSDIKQTEDGKLIGFNKQTGRYDLLPMPEGVRVGKPPSTTINVGQGQSEYEKEVGKGQAKSYLSLQDMGSSARRQLPTINQLANLSDEAISGSAPQAQKAIMRAAETIGLDVNGLAETEAFEALSNRLTLDKAQSLSGALSDKDIDFLQSTVPTLGQSKEGRKKLIGIMRDMAQLEIDYAKAASEYMRDRKGQVFDENEFAEWYAQNKRGNKDSLSKYYQSESNGKDKAIPNITTQAEFDALPSGARFYEDGRLLIKD